MDAVAHCARRTINIFLTIVSTLLSPVANLLRPVLRHFSAIETMESYAAMNHLALNVRRPETEWFNMGYWENASDLPTASRNLAKTLYETAGIRPGARVLDVGCGCGDSLLLLATDYKPSVLHGVTSLKSHAERARRRCAALPLDSKSACDVSVYCQDAVAFVEARASESSVSQEYDYIFALDCAYHFRTRARFVEAASQLLAPGGTLALVDLAAAHPYPVRGGASCPQWFTASQTLSPPSQRTPSLLARAGLALTTMLSSSHLDSCTVYHDVLLQAGLDGIHMRDISGDMFPGFAQWLTQLGLGEEATWRGGGWMQLAALRGFGRGPVSTWAKGGDEGTVRSVLVTAKSRRVH